LNEYAQRLAGDLLCDAQDYANHRASVEIDASDIQLALKLSKIYTSKAIGVERAIPDVQDAINKIPLNRLVNDKDFTVRYPKEKHPLIDSDEHPDVVTGLLQRTYTLIPGGSNNNDKYSNNNNNNNSIAASAHQAHAVVADDTDSNSNSMDVEGSENIPSSSSSFTTMSLNTSEVNNDGNGASVQVAAAFSSKSFT
jgi:hypothetical protein